MPTYRVTDPQTGKSVRLTGDSPPTEAELTQVFARLSPATEPARTPDRPPGLATIGDYAGHPSGMLEQLFAPMGPRTSKFVADAARGFAKRGAESVATAGRLLRKIPGVSAADDIVTPAVGDTTRRTPGERAGAMIEQAVEFYAPLSGVSKVVAGASLPMRMLAEGAAGGAAGMFQSNGDPWAGGGAAVLSAGFPLLSAGARLTRSALDRAAAGAKDGGVGGAIASVVRKVAPGAPRTMMVQALKPRNTRFNFESALDRAMPEINAAAQARGAAVSGVDDLLAVTKAAKRQIASQIDTMRGPMKQAGFQVDLSDVADAVAGSVPKRIQLKDPSRALAIREQSNVYRKSFDLEDAEAFLREANAELDSYYNKFPAARGKSLAVDPDVATVAAEAKALRDVIYKRLDDAGDGAAARELQKRYGALLEVEDTAFRRANVAKRQQPESLNEQMSGARAAGEYARGAWKLAHFDLTGAADIASGAAMRSTAKFMKDQQTTDALIRRAFANYDVLPQAVAMPVRRPVAGLLGRGPIVPPAPADRSFVRGVPAVPAVSGRPRQLGPGREAIVTPPPAAAESYARGVDAAPMEYTIDPTRRASEGFRVSQYSGTIGDLAAPPMPEGLSPVLRRMVEDLDTFTPQRGKLVRESLDNADSHYAAGTPGSPVGDDIRVISEQNVSNREIKQAILDLLNGKRPSNKLHTAVMDAAMGYIEKRPGYRGPAMGLSDLDDPGFDLKRLGVSLPAQVAGPLQAGEMVYLPYRSR